MTPNPSTATWEHLPRAPIVEALLDIRVVFSSPPPIEQLGALHEAIAHDYPIREKVVRWESELQFRAPSPEVAFRSGPLGFICRSADKLRAVQMREDGFTVNWLKPYRTWEDLRSAAKQHWELYRTRLNPVKVGRLQVRYINRIELPLPFNDFREFVRTAPDIAPELPQGLSALFLRLEIPDPRRKLVAIITETMEPPVDSGTRLPLIFDIDVLSHDPLDPSSPAIWDVFEQMREYKNEVFFRSITERGLELFR